MPSAMHAGALNNLCEGCAACTMSISDIFGLCAAARARLVRHCTAHGVIREHQAASRWRKSMKRIMLAVGMLVIPGGAWAVAEGVPGAQQRDCFAVTMNPTATLGAILVDKCTGNSWILGRVKPSTDATTLRWFPLAVEKRELVVPNEEKNDEDTYAGF
jgi:hypothetical protein